MGSKLNTLLPILFYSILAPVSAQAFISVQAPVSAQAFMPGKENMSHPKFSRWLMFI